MIVHILLAIVTYGLSTISLLYALLVLFEHHLLRYHKHVNWVMQNLPPLMVAETQLFQMIALTFVSLTLSMITGVMGIILLEENIFSQKIALKIFCYLGGWFLIGALLWAHWQYGLRGKIAIYWYFLIFAILVLAYLMK